MRHLLLFLLLCTALPLTAAEEAAADTAQAQPQQEQPSQEQAQPQPQEQPDADAAPQQDDTAQKEEPSKESDEAKKEDAAKKDEEKKEGEEEGGDDDNKESGGEFFIAAKAELGFGFSSVNNYAINGISYLVQDKTMFDFEAGIGVEGGYKFAIPFEVGLGLAYRYRVLADGADLLNFGNGNSILPYVAARFYIPLVIFELYPDIRLGCDVHLGGNDTTIPLFYGSVGVGFLFLEYFLIEASYSFEIGNELTGANRIKNWQLNVFTIRGGVRF